MLADAGMPVCQDWVQSKRKCIPVRTLDNVYDTEDGPGTHLYN